MSLLVNYIIVNLRISLVEESFSKGSNGQMTILACLLLKLRGLLAFAAIAPRLFKFVPDKFIEPWGSHQSPWGQPLKKPALAQ